MRTRVPAVDITVVEHAERLACDMVFAQSVEHAVTFGDDVGGKGAGQPLHRLKQPPHRSVCALVTQSRDEIDAVGHVCRPGCDHGKE